MYEAAQHGDKSSNTTAPRKPARKQYKYMCIMLSKKYPIFLFNPPQFWFQERQIRAAQCPWNFVEFTFQDLLRSDVFEES